ncbi:hypothetical protein SLE2022_133970 [Rubroshorea leprosula]
MGLFGHKYCCSQSSEGHWAQDLQIETDWPLLGLPASSSPDLIRSLGPRFLPLWATPGLLGHLAHPQPNVEVSAYCLLAWAWRCRDSVNCSPRHCSTRYYSSMAGDQRQRIWSEEEEMKVGDGEVSL